MGVDGPIEEAKPPATCVGVWSDASDERRFVIRGWATPLMVTLRRFRDGGGGLESEGGGAGALAVAPDPETELELESCRCRECAWGGCTCFNLDEGGGGGVGSNWSRSCSSLMPVGRAELLLNCGEEQSRLSKMVCKASRQTHAL